MRRRRNFRDPVALGFIRDHRLSIKSAAPPRRTDSTWSRRLPWRATTTKPRSRKFRAPRRSIPTPARSSLSATAAARSGTALKSHAARHPRWWDRANPLDDFTREVVERDVAGPLRASGARCTTVYPFMNNGPTLNFIELGKVAGVAGPSILGVTVHPLYGPWIAFRAALLLDEAARFAGRRARLRPVPAMHRAHMYSGVSRPAR